MLLIKKYGWPMAGLLAGAIVGYLYWRFVGCTSGSCPITSNPVHSSLYGALMGLMLTGSFQQKKFINNNKK